MTVKFAKTVIVGDAGVGKTCIARRQFMKHFDPQTEPTMGAEFYEGTKPMKDGNLLKFEVWDTAGQEVYPALAPVFFKESRIAILVFDVTKQKTLEALNYYVDTLNELTVNCFKAVVGNKIDLENQRQVSMKDGLNFAEKIGTKFYIETSAITGAGIDELFSSIALQDIEIPVPHCSPDLIYNNQTNSPSRSCC